MSRIERFGPPVVAHFEAGELVILEGTIRRLQAELESVPDAAEDVPDLDFGAESDTFAQWESEFADVKQPNMGPAHLRLLYPPAYSSNPALQQQYSEANRAGQTKQMSDALATMLLGLLDAQDTDGRVSLPADSAQEWVRGFNFLRLAIAGHLRVDEDVELDDSDETAFLAEVYEWLGFLQESFLDVLMSGGPDR